jgi:hypothetical protein
LLLIHFPWFPTEQLLCRNDRAPKLEFIATTDFEAIGAGIRRRVSGTPLLHR